MKNVEKFKVSDYEKNESKKEKKKKEIPQQFF